METALDYHYRAIDLFLEIGDTTNYAVNLLNVGVIRQLQGDYSNAGDTLKKATELLKIGNDRNLYIAGLFYLAKNLHVSGRRAEAKEAYQTAIDLSVKFQNNRFIAESSHRLGLLYAEMGNINQGLRLARFAKSEAEKYAYRNVLRDAYETLSQIYALDGDAKQVLSYREKFEALKDSISSSQLTESLATLRLKYETEKRDKEITFLQKERAADARGRLGLTLAIILGFALLLFVARSNVVARRQSRALAESNQSLKQALENVDRQRALLSQIEEMAHIGAFEYAVSSKELSVSAETLRIFERALDDPPKSLAEVQQYYSPDKFEHSRALFYNALHGEENSYEAELNFPNRPKKFVRVTHKPAFDDAKRVVKIYGRVEDFTARKTSETEKAQLTEQLIQSQKMESLGVLASGVAHEFNNILHSIAAYVALLRNSVGLRDKDVERLAKINAIINRAASIIRQMLGFARKGQISIEPLDLHHCVVDVIQMLETTLDKRIKVSLDAEFNLPLINGDKSQLEQVVLNLALNARDAMLALLDAPGAQPNLKFSLNYVLPPLSARTRHGVAAENYFVHLAVSDNGAGISEEILDKIFEPFFTTKAVGKGTGLGLSMAYGIVKSHNGFFWVESKLGVGSTFHLYFPPIAERLAPSASVNRLPKANAAGKILVVDDEEFIRETLNDFLQAQGYAVRAAATGAEAVELFEAELGQFDVVVLDLNMPEMNGIDAFREIKRIQPSAKVILATGYLESNAAAQLLQEGFYKIFQKPFDIADLLAAVSATPDSVGSAT